MNAPDILTETIEPMIRGREPNFLRLALNPHVAQACYCLDRLFRSAWPGRVKADEPYQTFLANGVEEALGGALKLVRQLREGDADGAPGLIVDLDGRLRIFAGVDLTDGGRVEFLPGLVTIDEAGILAGELDRIEGKIGVVILSFSDLGKSESLAGPILDRVARDGLSLIACVDRAAMDAIRRAPDARIRNLTPDVVVFDDSFVDRAVPFAAFTARQSLFESWNRPKKSTFHSTTFQPNTISTRHLVACLLAADPAFAREHQAELGRIRDDFPRRVEAIRRHYNPSLARLIRASGFAKADTIAEGGTFRLDGQGGEVFDMVAGIACSIRGHNPPRYVEEIRALRASGPAISDRLRETLRSLTGLGQVLPAVSGATAVENAIKLALTANSPRRSIIALKAGFGGKTLLSLAGTANPYYKKGIGPLYADVHYVDPFAPDAIAQVDALLERGDIALVLMELIQSVGGVRRIPETLVRHLDRSRASRGYILAVDEVQTGMFRTGPFNHSSTFDLTPDILLMGKGTSDMVFPFALTLYSDDVAARLASKAPELPDAIRERNGYDLGEATTLNVLKLAEAVDLPKQVEEAGSLLRELLTKGLAKNPSVRDIRVFGLLIAIECVPRGVSSPWLAKRLAAFYLLAMLKHRTYPVLVGFCQYEPNTLKVTPPLNATRDQITRSCETIVEVLGRPLHRLVLGGLAQLIRNRFARKEAHEHRDRAAPELAAH